MGAVGPDACILVPPKIDVIIGMIAAANIPAKIPLPDCNQNAAHNESAANDTVRPARKSVKNL